MITERARQSLDRIAKMEQEPDRTVEDLVSSSPDMPREVAQYTVDRDPYRKLPVGERIEREFHGFRTHAAARNATAEELFAAELEANDVRTRSIRTMKRPASSAWAQNVLRVGLRRKVLGEIRETPDLAHVLYREALGEDPTMENSIGPWVITLMRAAEGWRLIDDSIVYSKVHVVGLDEDGPRVGQWTSR